MTIVIETATGRRARGRLCVQDEVEASFRPRRSPMACIFEPGTYRGFYGDDAWFVSLCLDEDVSHEGTEPEDGVHPLHVVLMILGAIGIIAFAAIAEMTKNG